MAPTDSILQRQVTLPNLLEGDAFTDVLRTFASDLGRAIRVLDATGRIISEAEGPTLSPCEAALRHGGVIAAGCGVTRALQIDPSAAASSASGLARVACAHGCRSAAAPIHYDGDRLGTIVYGPLAGDGPRDPEAQTPDEVARAVERLGGAGGAGTAGGSAPPGDAKVAHLASMLGRVMDAILFAGYKALLTSNMHIEAVTESFRELEEKNEKLRVSYDKLKELDRLKSNFLATMSHELRTPLTSVIGYSELLLSGMAGPLNEEQNDYVKTIMEKGESLLQMINSVLDISKIESGTLTLNRTRMRLDDVIRGAVTTVMPMAQKKHLKVDVEVESNLPAVTGDREKLGQVVNNLLTNAVKFTPGGGNVTVKAWRFVDRSNGKPMPVASDSAPIPGSGGDTFGEGAGDPFGLAVGTDPFRDSESDPFSVLGDSAREWVRVDVTDSGIGIPTDKVDKVFETFYQVDGSSTREYGGAGLGLSIVRNFVKAHGGSVWVESELGKGSCFSFVVPVDPAA